MDIGITVQCIVAVAPMRNEPAHGSEMVSQMLLGEMALVVGQASAWIRVRMQADGYEGWVQAKQTAKCTPVARNEGVAQVFALDRLDMVHHVHPERYIQVPLGSLLYGWNGKSFEIAGEKYHYPGEIIVAPAKYHASLAVRIARRCLGVPYLWGGRSTLGTDCSGLVQLVCRMAGCQLPRDASQQVKFGKVVDFVDEARSGDLAFFEDSNGNIIHTGIICGKGKIIHASGEVRIDSLDHYGIFDQGHNEYSHSLRVIKRL